MSINYSCIKPFGAIVTAPLNGDSVAELKIDCLREILREHKLIVLRGFQSFQSAADFAAYCRLWGEICLWPFGEVLELVEHENPEDHIFDHSYVPLHWDGMYRKQVPELQIFQCVSAPAGEGEGRTTFSNTAMMLQRITDADRSLWGQASITYLRKMEYYESRTEAPIICAHPYRNYDVVRYCEPTDLHDLSFINHPDIKFNCVSGLEEKRIKESLRQALYDPRNFYAHTWQSGDLVIADNYTLLHGREQFTSGSKRHLRRVHVSGNTPLNNPHLVQSL
jgi:alpha-ketoglutarate-dependent taurine dioxygenase